MAFGRRFSHFRYIRLTSPLIELDGLCKSYGKDNAVLSDISFSIAEGETVALIGSNGAGKSTLLKCLVGLHANSGGTVRTFDQTFKKSPTRAQRRAIRKQIGFVFQSHGLVRRASALSNVVHGFLGQPGSWRAYSQSFARGDWREQAHQALGAVKLEHKAKSRVDELSGGQAQRVAIARALVRKPRLFIADEPAASLDPAAGHDVMQQFAELAKSHGITLIYTSHDMDHAVKYSDRVIALKDKRVLFDAKSSEIERTSLSEVFNG